MGNNMTPCVYISPQIITTYKQILDITIYSFTRIDFTNGSRRKFIYARPGCISVPPYHVCKYFYSFLNVYVFVVLAVLILLVIVKKFTTLLAKDGWLDMGRDHES